MRGMASKRACQRIASCGAVEADMIARNSLTAVPSCIPLPTSRAASATSGTW